MKYLSFKITDVCIQEDAVSIEATVTKLEKRWKEVLGQCSARKKQLDENYKLSQKFFKGVDDLLKMLDESEQSLKSEEPIGVDPAHLRVQLKKHKVRLDFSYLFCLFFCLSIGRSVGQSCQSHCSFVKSH